MSTKKIQIIDSLVKQAENANTLDGKSAEEFALTSDVEELQLQVGDSSVADQIESALAAQELEQATTRWHRVSASCANYADLDSVLQSLDSLAVYNTIIDLTITSGGELNIDLTAKNGKDTYGDFLGIPYLYTHDMGKKYYGVKLICLEDNTLWNYVDSEYEGQILIRLSDTNIPIERTIAGIDLADNITADELQTALDTYPVKTVMYEPTTNFKGQSGQFCIGGMDAQDYKLYVCTGENENNEFRWVSLFDKYVKSVNNTLPDANGNVTLTVTAEQPEFVVKDTTEEALEWLNENGDTSKTYVLPDGYIYSYTQTVQSYTNVIPLSIGSDGTIFNNGKGWANSSRIGSGGIYLGNGDSYVTGHIEINPTVNNTIRLKNVVMENTGANTNHGIAFFNSSFARVPLIAGGSYNWVQISALTEANNYSPVLEGNNVVEFTLKVPAHISNPDIKYMAICCGELNDDSIITINEEIVENLTYIWKNTGVKYCQDDYSGAIEELNVTTNTHTNQIEEINERLNSIGSENTNIPYYWQAHLNTRVDNIREAMELAGRNKSAFLFYSDAHWDDGGKNAPMLLNYLFKHTPINKTLFGGDIVNVEPTTETLSDRTIMEYLWEWRSQIRDLKQYSVIGNHDDGNATNNIFSSDYVYSFLFAPEEDNRGIVRDADTYYYFDDTREKTRYICLDTAYESAYTLSTEQEAFIKETLKSTQENYHIVVLSHIWYGPDYDQYSVRPIPLTGLSTTAQSVCNILDNYNARTGDFTDCKAKVEFCIGGHVHRDYVDKTAGGIPIILCECAGLGWRGAFSASVGTISETAVSGIIADYDNDKVSVIRIGRGNSFEVDLTTGSSTDIPDSEPTEPDTPIYTNVLNTVGWTDGIRLSAGDGGDRTSEINDTTGFIPCKSGDTIYLKNVNMVNGDTNYCNVVYHFKEDKSFINGYYYNEANLGDRFSKVTIDENGYYTQIPVEIIEDVAFIRISCLGIDETSIITVNEPIE